MKKLVKKMAVILALVTLLSTTSSAAPASAEICYHNYVFYNEVLAHSCTFHHTAAGGADCLVVHLGYSQEYRCTKCGISMVKSDDRYSHSICQ